MPNFGAKRESDGDGHLDPGDDVADFLCLMLPAEVVEGLLLVLRRRLVLYLSTGDNCMGEPGEWCG